MMVCYKQASILVKLSLTIAACMADGIVSVDVVALAMIAMLRCAIDGDANDSQYYLSILRGMEGQI